SFYQRKEVKDLIAYLRLAVNPNDDEAFRRVINYPKRGIGNTTVDKAGELAASLDQPLWQSIGNLQASARAKNAIADFVGMIKEFNRRAATDNAHELASYIAKRSGILDELKQ
ncbi:3'-5' exonuclease, partial [Arthrospira platensis SPKY1]|nr:3'-5' exonuclease [Arthrospira platensis SPKY1]